MRAILTPSWDTRESYVLVMHTRLAVIAWWPCSSITNPWTKLTTRTKTSLRTWETSSTNLLGKHQGRTTLAREKRESSPSKTLGKWKAPTERHRNGTNSHLPTSIMKFAIISNLSYKTSKTPIFNRIAMSLLSRSMIHIHTIAKTYHRRWTFRLQNSSNSTTQTQCQCKCQCTALTEGSIANSTASMLDGTLMGLLGSRRWTRETTCLECMGNKQLTSLKAINSTRIRLIAPFFTLNLWSISHGVRIFIGLNSLSFQQMPPWAIHSSTREFASRSTTPHLKQVTARKVPKR